MKKIDWYSTKTLKIITQALLIFLLVIGYFVYNRNIGVRWEHKISYFQEAKYKRLEAEKKRIEEEIEQKRREEKFFEEVDKTLKEVDELIKKEEEKKRGSK